MEEDRIEWRIMRFRSVKIAKGKIVDGEYDYTYQIFKVCIDGEKGFMYAPYDMSSDMGGYLIYGDTIEALKADHESIKKAFNKPMVRWDDSNEYEHIIEIKE